jgi:hypothetical protein
VPATLVISDLHLGARGALPVLERPEPLRILLEALDRCERLVLLGDIVELQEVRARAAVAAAAPVLRAIGARLGPGTEVVLVPGNHDRALIRGWIRARGRMLGRSDEVPADASPLLSEIVRLLAPAPVSVRYPGVELEPGVWATHGHYLDHHLVPVSTYGLLSRADAGHGGPRDYERPARLQLGSIERLLPLRVVRILYGVGALGRAFVMRRVRSHVLRPGLAPLTASLLGRQLRRHGLPALGRVLDHLEVDAGTVIFGHVHRLGPGPEEDPAAWELPGGTRLWCTGSWVHEPLLVHRARPPHPYWPGGSIWLEDGRVSAVGLLDGMTSF